MNIIFTKSLKNKSTIAGVKDINDLDKALESDCEIIFLLCGTIFNLKESVNKAKEKKKLIFAFKTKKYIALEKKKGAKI